MGKWTHDVGVIEILAHISHHRLSPFPLIFFFEMVFSATSCVTFPTVLAEGLCVAAKESVVSGRVGVAVEESMGRLHDDHDVKLVIYLQYCFRVYSPERLSDAP